MFAETKNKNIVEHEQVHHNHVFEFVKDRLNECKSVCQ